MISEEQGIQYNEAMYDNVCKFLPEHFSEDFAEGLILLINLTKERFRGFDSRIVSLIIFVVLARHNQHLINFEPKYQ